MSRNEHDFSRINIHGEHLPRYTANFDPRISFLIPGRTLGRRGCILWAPDYLQWRYWRKNVHNIG